MSDDVRPIRVPAYADPHTADCECGPHGVDPALAAGIQRSMREALALFESEESRVPETDLGVLVSSALAFGYFAAYDHRMVKAMDSAGRKARGVDPIVGYGTGEIIGFLGAPAEAMMLRTPEDKERAHVFDHLVPLVRAAAGPQPPPPTPPRPPYPPPYPSSVRSAVDPVTGYVGSPQVLQVIADHRRRLADRGRRLVDPSSGA